MPGPGRPNVHGPPPPDHPRRCQALRRCGERCRRWALKESPTCQFHGGRKKQKKKYWTQHVARFYKRALSETLKDVLTEQLLQKPDEQLNLFEELALMRSVAERHVKIYSVALDTGKEEIIMSAAELMASNLQRVAEICKLAAQIHTEQKEKFSIHDLNYVIEQVIRISYDVFKDSPLANVFATRIRNELQLTDRVKGTTVTPDQTVQEMDESVP